ncbi:type II and III secretion system protein family protein [Microbaculum marinisediminis]|uniref:Type II and III secretion system protein family protein n=1 Tax=Microbaculum marinisediminis TaxID=2931392 RepID=A0AAW5QYM6_9HYPH|nr:type II and III secretion system protein family protein [Microbaculum sp. A6E488]MCT8972014.1 type II and III secretion system protein family protein [Microbaculum sp. A6E488]
MARRSIRYSVLAFAFAVAAIVLNAVGAAPAEAQSTGHMTIQPAELSASRLVKLGLGKSLVIDLPRDAKDVLVSSPKVADAVMRTARRAYLIGLEVGQTNVFFFDVAGRQIAVIELQVDRDTMALSQSIRQLVPGSAVKVESMNDNIVLTGTAPTAADAEKATDIAGRFAGDPAKVLNMIAVEGSEQVFLKVTVAEVKRQVLKELGIDWNLQINSSTIAANVISNPVFGLGLSQLPALTGPVTWSDGTTAISAQVRALESNGLLRVLAEPTLSAISGETANFLAGGEFPVPIGNTCDPDTGQCQLSIEFKPFGVALAFTPVVMSANRISLKVKTEVSEIDRQSEVVLQDTRIPGIKTRRTDTTVELPSGGSLALAGLIQQDSKQVFNSVPGIGDIPILGTLFRSRDFQTDETELVILATPYMVEPTSRDELARPDKNFAPASDPAAILLGRLNRLYGLAEKNPAGNYRGPIGFIVE